MGSLPEGHTKYCVEVPPIPHAQALLEHHDGVSAGGCARFGGIKKKPPGAESRSGWFPALQPYAARAPHHNSTPVRPALSTTSLHRTFVRLQPSKFPLQGITHEAIQRNPVRRSALPVPLRQRAREPSPHQKPPPKVCFSIAVRALTRPPSGFRQGFHERFRAPRSEESKQHDFFIRRKQAEIPLGMAISDQAHTEPGQSQTEP